MSQAPIRCSVVVESKLSAINKVCRWILAKLRANRFSQDDIFAVHLALQEAFINAVKHGNKMDPTKEVRIDYSVDLEKVEIFMTDEGEGFDPQAVPDPRLSENLYKPEGRGLLLMRAYMDVVEFNERGNCVHMVRYKERNNRTKDVGKQNRQSKNQRTEFFSAIFCFLTSILLFGRQVFLLGIWAYLLFLSGCIYSNEPMPEIVYDPALSRQAPIVQRKTIPPVSSRNYVSDDIPSSWLPPSHLEKRWTAIVIHHSGTSNGNAAIFDRWHRENRHWEGVGYDFVIGNGTDSGDGEVEVTFRWRNQMTGAHCKTPNNWANEHAIGICLVGDFNRATPTASQMRSLVKLVRFLQNRYNIPKNRIYGHNTTPGAHKTDCPGRNFPMAKLKSMLEF